ncbi:MAG: SGNH/GDSL hydrolase family protein [Candidatus Latescibacteria bacterium]|nr:SGNH/GDSL hydrolase family protein [Candidatus Latescibacterota bacterium]
MKERLLALGLGILLVLAFEGGLRLFPGLAPPPLVLELAREGERTLLTVNPAYPRRFFTGALGDQAAPGGMRMTPHPFVEPRPPSAFRVVFAGESTVQGYPHPRRLSAGAYLQAMLQDTWPQRQVEVFNAGITAISSFAVARTVEDAAMLHPDLMVVYTGHNELYGVYGAASLKQGGGSVWTKGIYYELMQARLTRLLGAGLARLGNPSPARASLLQVMAQAGTLAPADPRRQRASRTLEENLAQIARCCREANIPLVLCTLVSNETGFAPAPAPPPLAEPQLGEWARCLEEAGTLLQGTPGPDAARRALGLLDEAVALYAADARLQFQRGQCLQVLGEGAQAHAAFVQARDEDPRPWRAPSAYNPLIRQVAQAQGARLAEVEEAFAQASPAAGVGWELMADHLHPSAPGQVLLARTIAHALLTPEEEARLRSDGEYRAQQGDLPVEKLAVCRAMIALLSEPPLDTSGPEHVAQLQQESQGLWAELSPAERAGCERWARGRGPELLVLNVADQAFANRDFALARTYYQAARLEEPYTVWGDLWATLRWGRCQELQGGLEPGTREEVEQLMGRARLLALAPDFDPALLAFFEGYALHLLGRRAEAAVRLEQAAADQGIQRTFSFDLLSLLTEELVALGRHAEAEQQVVQITGALGQREFGQQLLNYIRAAAAH